jgi:hypothetical protein
MLTYHVVETFCVGKGTPEQNEDRLVILPHAIAVVDGATSSTPIDGIAGGIIAAEATVGAIHQLSIDWNFRELVDCATHRLAERLGNHHANELPGPAATVLAWNPGRDELYRLGDSHARLDDQVLIGDKKVDQIGSAFRVACLEARLRLGHISVTEARNVSVLADVHKSLIEVQHAYQNRDNGHPLEYGAIDGRPVPDRFLEVYSTTGVQDLVLCSDGFLAPCASLSDAITDLDRLRANDPLLFQTVCGSRAFPTQGRFFDDTSYVRIHVER